MKKTRAIGYIDEFVGVHEGREIARKLEQAAVKRRSTEFLTPLEKKHRKVKMPTFKL